MTKPPTLNRFPLFGLFAYRAALRIGHPEPAARLLGYSTALLYAIFKTRGQGRQATGDQRRTEGAARGSETVSTETVLFGGQDFAAVRDQAGNLSQTVIAREAYSPESYESQIRGKFAEGWHDRLAVAFDEYLRRFDPHALNRGNALYELYKGWRDDCKVGLNRVDLDKLLEWLRERRPGSTASDG